MNEYVILALVIIGYFFPVIIAAKRGHKNATPIFLVNLLFGWTGLGWLWCLIWSTTGNVKDHG